jgi:hypothetical protein
VLFFPAYRSSPVLDYRLKWGFINWAWAQKVAYLGPRQVTLHVRLSCKGEGLDPKLCGRSFCDILLNYCKRWTITWTSNVTRQVIMLGGCTQAQCKRSFCDILLNYSRPWTTTWTSSQRRVWMRRKGGDHIRSRTQRRREGLVVSEGVYCRRIGGRQPGRLGSKMSASPNGQSCFEGL